MKFLYDTLMRTEHANNLYKIENSDIYHTWILNVFAAAAKDRSSFQVNKKIPRTSIDSINTPSEESPTFVVSLTL